MPGGLEKTPTGRRCSRFNGSRLTGNLNRGGVFIRTDDPLRIRELCEVRIQLNDGGDPIDHPCSEFDGLHEPPFSDMGPNLDSTRHMTLQFAGL